MRATGTARRGFALLLVMILVAVGVVLGVSYLSVASLKVRVSENFQSLQRARYLAESGLEHAKYLLRYSPERLDGTPGNPLGPYYVDNSADRYYISATPDGSVPGKYTLTATAVVGGVQRSSSVTVQRSPGAQIEIEQGVLVGGGFVWLPWSLTLKGDFHANGFLLNMARIEGDASATTGLWDPWHRISGDTEGRAETVETPRLKVTQYTKYELNGVKCKATKFKGTHLTRNDPLADGGAITSENPAGVVYLKPKVGNTVTLHTGLKFRGTLVIKGNIRLGGRNITITPVDGFPAIVATGAVQVTNVARNVKINGLVSADYGIVPGQACTACSRTTINGALVSRWRGYSPALMGGHRLNYNADRAKVYDMSVPSSKRVPTVTVLDWQD